LPHRTELDEESTCPKLRRPARAVWPSQMSRLSTMSRLPLTSGSPNGATVQAPADVDA
jgi:hypothetical protein